VIDAVLDEGPVRMATSCASRAAIEATSLQTSSPRAT
jgi:hypothetical protein